MTIEQLTDEDLLAAIAARDTDALGALYRRHVKLVFFITKRIIFGSDVEDCVHEVFLAIWRKAHTFDLQRGTAKKWIVQVAYGTCFDYLEHLKRRHGANEKPFDVFKQESVASSYHPEMVDVERVLPRLTLEQRRVIYKIYWLGMTCAEIAAQEGRNKLSVKHTSTRVLAKLRKLLLVS